MSGDRQFVTTQWSIVLAAGRGDDSAAREALAELCRLYWYPLYAYVRRRGHDASEAQDLTQAFLLFLLEKQSLQVAERRRGRFRSFLLSSLNNFIANQKRDANAQRRGGKVEHFSIDIGECEDRYRHEPAHELTAQRIFERRWALTALEEALRQTEAEYVEQGKGTLFAALRPTLIASANGPPYREIAETLSMTAGAVKVAVHRLRRSYGLALRRIIAATVASTEDVDDELNDLMAALKG